MRYLLDTNTVIAAANDPTSPVRRRLNKHSPEDIGVSAVVIYELFYGAFKSRHKDRNIAVIDSMAFEVIEFDKNDARESGHIRAYLESNGTLIGPYDMLIAGQAKARGLTLVTANVSEFKRVPGLRSENWS
jgi:tRNA(fMet)-specific endonuclease VapC